jgi:hypothetical protein
MKQSSYNPFLKGVQHARDHTPQPDRPDRPDLRDHSPQCRRRDHRYRQPARPLASRQENPQRRWRRRRGDPQIPEERPGCLALQGPTRPQGLRALPAGWPQDRPKAAH